MRMTPEHVTRWRIEAGAWLVGSATHAANVARRGYARDRVASALYELAMEAHGDDMSPATADTVAIRLEALRCFGEHTTDGSPLANFVRMHGGYEPADCYAAGFVAFGRWAERFHVPLPLAVAEFGSLFEAGKYPRLDTFLRGKRGLL